MTVIVRNRYRFGRLWLSFVAILLGLLAGYFVGRQSILHATSSRLRDYADRLLQRDEELASEIRTTLIQANDSSYPACSNQDIVLLRRLTFAARFLKDVGRLHENNFVCSATTGKLPAPKPLRKPDILVPSGPTIYRSYPLTVPSGDYAPIVTYRDADVVVSPDVFVDFPQQPLHFAVGMRNTPNGDRSKESTLTGGMKVVSVPTNVLASQDTVRNGETLYRARCSNQFPLCAVTNIRIPEIWQASRTLLYGYTATGGVAGAWCATALLLAGRKRRSHTSQLRRAILMDKLSVAYQPIVELGSHRIVGAEALARWTDEDGDSVRPETIIALAEAEGFVSEITRFVLTRALEELRSVLETDQLFRLSINLAPSDLADPRLLLLLDETLNGSDFTAANLTFELTERATSDREVAVAAIRRLRQRGHAVYIDDFGTGYSNLAYLTELDVDGIKINRSFIATIGTESVTASIVPQILAVAKALSLNVVVQGIERVEQATYFASDDPKMLGQGWFFGLPTTARNLKYLCAERTE